MNTNTKKTISEQLFEKLCLNKGICYERIPETDTKTADYILTIHGVTIIAEVKQLDFNEKDEQIKTYWGKANGPPVESPAVRIQELLNRGYPQIKTSSKDQLPAIIVLFNNAGAWNKIDIFAVSKAMFGSYGIVLGLKPDQKITEIGRGYLGKRKTTKDSFRSLSAVGVIDGGSSQNLSFACYHNPFAKNPIEPKILDEFADTQYIHKDPHARGFIHWKPQQYQKRLTTSIPK